MKKLTVVALLMMSSIVFADQGRDQDSQGRGNRVPPESAISACEGKEDQASCTMEGRRGESVTGVCENTPDDKYFACKPSRENRPKRSSN